MRPQALLPLLFAFLASCIPLAISGSTVPTEHTFQLTAHDIAAAESTDCAQAWVTGDVHTDLAAAKAKLKKLGIRVKVGNRTGFHMALRRKLWLQPGFFEMSKPEQVVFFSHELGHYCQRGEMGDTAFEKATLHSAGRYRAETPMYAQGFRTMLIYCVPPEKVEAAIEDRLVRFRDSYWLWDIDPEQYETETRRIWRRELDAAPPCD